MDMQAYRKTTTEARKHPHVETETPVFDIRPAYASTRSSDMQSAVIPDALSSTQSWQTTAYATTSEDDSSRAATPTHGYTNIPHTWPEPPPAVAEPAILPGLTMHSNEHPGPGLDVLATLDDMLARQNEQQNVDAYMRKMAKEANTGIEA
ncbi:hypothetical protein CYLTODRAFT_425588 [Cylindrobasidium torrendii FP15055 ss-10]|uniref:Uncharacterized protein n=1 Tax=Cylindrobasidium torrendii FP15055 ss-10 TaxID=1314674 RepID=A0A0D7B1C7_9AGAR|nr:hypothetical protein CYLTODRAFT_425588 [Cylindrobasidium torrendii FP15055 ss-10]